MEGIYQSNLYTPQQLPYVLPPSHPEQNSYSNYGNPQQQYRSSAFSDARSSPTSNSTPYHHSAGLNNTTSSSNNNYASHGEMNNNSHHHHHHHHHDTTSNNNHTNDTYHNNNSNNNNSTSTNWASSSPNLSWNSSPPPLPPPSRNNSYSYGSNNNNNTLPHMSTPIPRPKLTTTVWEDEGTLCYQVDAKSVCVARRQDNDMINGTKLLNVVGMSRGKRDGILKNEKGRVVVKVGAMHLKGVWITFSRAKDLASKFKIEDILYPLFVEDPSVFLSVPPPPASSNGLPIMLPSSTANNNATRGAYYNKNDNFGSFNMQSWEKQPYQSLPSITNQQQQDQMIIRSQQNNLQNSGSCSPVPGSIAPILSNEESDMYLLNNPYEYRNQHHHNNNSRYGNTNSTPTSSNQHHHQQQSYNIYPSETHSSDHHFSSPYESHTSPYLHSSAAAPPNRASAKPTASSASASNTASNAAAGDKEEEKRSIDFPSSPPPESSATLKYAGSPYPLNSSPPAWSESNDASSNRKSPLAGLVMVSGRHPLSSEIEEKSLSKGRKRQQEKSTIPTIQRKRMKNHSEKDSP
ncbi:uncharacterized protein EV154DRAFT_525648 [Mucor mucedo]|uniref:uncharacterized protein n=1 Tax=Mucor mucedo TaxID=29922 RepID=UPI00221FCAE5|nr:uncharacterized protein EV154DRAFT_525648 [Mucor mucedo]KAI7876778.1 hypothetical protein EV154DRAFT_525648 [Mucor mucedo]